MIQTQNVGIWKDNWLCQVPFLGLTCYKLFVEQTRSINVSKTGVGESSGEEDSLDLEP